MVHDEGHDPGGSVLSRIRNHAETAHHFAPHEIIVSTPRGVLTLSVEQLVIVAMIRHRFPSGSFVSLSSGSSYQGTEGTRLLTWFCLPEEPVAFSLGADKLLCVLQQLVAIRVALIVLALCVHKGQRDLDHVQL